MKELIELAKEKGFESDLNLILSAIEYEPNSITEARKRIEDYLWMCELQKWLRDEKQIIIGCESFNNDSNKFNGLVIYCPIIEKVELGKLFLNSKHYKLASDNYSQALETGLTEALKLL